MRAIAVAAARADLLRLKYSAYVANAPSGAGSGMILAALTTRLLGAIITAVVRANGYRREQTAFGYWLLPEHC